MMCTTVQKKFNPENFTELGMYYRDLFLQPIIAKILPTNLSSSELPYPWVEFLVNLKTHCFVSSISSKRRATLPGAMFMMM